MRALMGVTKDRHGTYCALVRVPVQAVVARVLGNGKPRQAYLKKSLGTKDLLEANIRAKLVLAGFDRTIKEATAVLAQGVAKPLVRSALNEAEIARIAEHVYGTTLAWDERSRFGGRDFFKQIEVESRRQQLAVGDEPDPQIAQMAQRRRPWPCQICDLSPAERHCATP
jgi:hypothetical protein